MKGLLAVMLLASPLAALAASNPDESFYKNAAEAGIAEVDAGTLAQEKGSSDKVKEFAAMMVKDHSAANEKLKTLAGTKGVDLPTSASMGQMANKAKLEMMKGDSFDKSYVKGQVKAHKDTIALFKKEAMNGQDADAKAFAKATLPTLQAHLKAINMIATTSGATS